MGITMAPQLAHTNPTFIRKDLSAALVGTA